MRQLHLFPGLPGESFPYRADFVFKQNVRPGTLYSKGLICMKFDTSELSEEPSAPRRPTYLPLRHIEGVVGAFAQKSSLCYFQYHLGKTIDYSEPTRAAQYSAEIEKAVASVLSAADESLSDTDANLVIRVPLSETLSDTQLEMKEETDRWIKLTKMLARTQTYEKLGATQSGLMKDRYSKICYGRVSGISLLDDNRNSELVAIGGTNEQMLDANSSYRLEALTSVDSSLTVNKLFHYNLNFDSELFDVIDTDIQVSAGVLRHDFFFRCRKPTSHTQLKIAVAEKETVIHVPEIVLPLKIRDTVATRFWEYGPLCFIGIGILLGLIAVFLPATGKEMNPFLEQMITNVYGRGFSWLSSIILSGFGDEIRGLLKFLAIVFSSVGGWLAFGAEKRYKVQVSK
jgi:hypothetical protein